MQFQAFDNDKNDEIHYSISSQDFTIDEFTGQVYYNSEQYLSEEISADIQVQHLSYDPVNLDFITVLPRIYATPNYAIFASTLFWIAVLPLVGGQGGL